jgi:hypothetical protein
METSNNGIQLFGSEFIACSSTKCKSFLPTKIRSIKNHQQYAPATQQIPDTKNVPMYLLFYLYLSYETGIFVPRFFRYENRDNQTEISDLITLERDGRCCVIFDFLGRVSTS